MLNNCPIGWNVRSGGAIASSSCISYRGGAIVSTETIYAIEHGKRQPTVATLDKIAKALGAEVRDFF